SAPLMSALLPYTTLFRSLRPNVGRCKYAMPRPGESDGRALPQAATRPRDQYALHARAPPVDHSESPALATSPSCTGIPPETPIRSEEHTSELQSPDHLVS